MSYIWSQSSQLHQHLHEDVCPFPAPQGGQGVLVKTRALPRRFSHVALKRQRKEEE
jgi:hypothetical protein